MEEGRRLGSLWRRLPLAYAGSVGVFALAAAYLALRDHYTVPNADDWRILDEFQSRPYFEWLFSFQNGHRPAITLLLLSADQVLLDGQMRLLVIVGLLTTALAVAAFGWAVSFQESVVTPLALTTLSFAGFVLLWSGSCFHFLWGMCQAYTLLALFLLAAIGCLLAARRRIDAGGSGSGLAAAAGFAALLATFSHGAGFATWAAALAVAVAARLPRRVVGGLSAAAVLTLAVYSIGLTDDPRISAEGSLGALFGRSEEVLDFVVYFIGSLAGRISNALGGRGLKLDGLAGVLGLLWWAGFSAWLIFRPQRARPLALLALGIMTFAVVAACITALGRVSYPGSARALPAAPRFVFFSSLYLLGLVCAFAALVRSDAATRGFALAVPLLSLAMLPALGPCREYHDFRRVLLRHKSVLLLLDLRHDAFAEMMALGDAHSVYRVAGRLREQRRSIFADERARLLGVRIAERFETAPAGRCAGEVGAVKPFPETTGPAAAVRGQAWDLEADAAPAYVVFADGAGLVRGLAAFPSARPRPFGASADVRRRESRWSGFIADPRPNQSYAAYAVLSDRRHICRLGDVAGASAP